MLPHGAGVSSFISIDITSGRCHHNARPGTAGIPNPLLEAGATSHLSHGRPKKSASAGQGPNEDRPQTGHQSGSASSAGTCTEQPTPLVLKYHTACGGGEATQGLMEFRSNMFAYDIAKPSLA
jgi:hypothetical protein